ncbi:MAG: MFS transporter, partial [Alphaproteobacteria bacterium]|nr:MFS transporter [Alphaproteobacteria bacterium]
MTDSAISAGTIVARVERLPISRWHNFMRVVIGSATFFDAFDSLAIAFVLPVLIGMWHLEPGQIGLLISAGYVGQLIGAIFFGWLAERYGRLRSLTWTIVVISVLSVACAFAWDIQSLAGLRFLQGLGLGGEVPIALAYVNEFARAQNRGRFVLLFQSIFPVGIVIVSLVAIYVVPHWGWQWMFIIGAVPALLAAALRRLLPESPRWLATVGRLADADRVVRELEARVAADTGAALPPPVAVPDVAAERRASWRDLFAGLYLRRTLMVWVAWFVAAFVGYGITIWLPTIYRTVYKLPVQEALQFSFIANIALVAGVLTMTYAVDHTGRRPGFSGAFALSAIPLALLWVIGPTGSVLPVVILTTIASYFASMLQLGLVLYASELYPTRMR